MFRKLFAIVLGCALLAPAVASAHATFCSPGFWKNHVETFCNADGTPRDLPRCPEIEPYLSYPESENANATCCGDAWEVNGEPVDCAALIYDLNTGGACPDSDGDGDPDCPRHDGTEFLNSCFVFEWLDTEWQNNPCPDEIYPYED